jgi:hypothetical protein
MAKIYDFKAQTSKGKEIDFSQFEGVELDTIIETLKNKEK